MIIGCTVVTILNNLRIITILNNMEGETEKDSSLKSRLFHNLRSSINPDIPTFDQQIHRKHCQSWWCVLQDWKALITTQSSLLWQASWFGSWWMVNDRGKTASLDYSTICTSAVGETWVRCRSDLVERAWTVMGIELLSCVLSDRCVFWWRVNELITCHKHHEGLSVCHQRDTRGWIDFVQIVSRCGSGAFWGTCQAHWDALASALILLTWIHVRLFIPSTHSQHQP